MVCNCKSPINGQLMYFSEISLKKKNLARSKLSQEKKKKKIRKRQLK